MANPAGGQVEVQRTETVRLAKNVGSVSRD